MKSGIMQVHVPGRYEGTERRRGLRVHADVGATMRPLLPTVLERIEVRVLDESEGGLKLLTPGFLTLEARSRSIWIRSLFLERFATARRWATNSVWEFDS